MNLSLSLTNNLSLTGSSSFNPATLFASGEEGALFDPSNLSSLFQLSNGTTAVAVGDPVGYIADQSGNANHAIQATAANRPLLQQDAGGKYYLDADGTNDYLAATLTGNIAQPSTMFAAYRFDAVTDAAIMDAADAALSTARRNFMGVLSGNVSIFGGTGVLGATAANTTANHIVIAVFNALSSSVEADGVATGPGDVGSGAPQTGNNLALFAGADLASLRMNGRYYAGGCINRALTAGEKANLVAWLNGKAGL
jgi:hypothetical protein